MKIFVFDMVSLLTYRIKYSVLHHRSCLVRLYNIGEYVSGVCGLVCFVWSVLFCLFVFALTVCLLGFEGWVGGGGWCRGRVIVIIKLIGMVS